MAVAISARGLGKRYSLRTRGGLVVGMRTLKDEIYHLAGLLSPGRWRQGRGEDADTILWALQDFDIDIDEGEVVGLVGHNGSGKSTLLKILAEVTEPTSGYVDIRGRVGTLLEVQPGFHPELTGRENVYLGGGILGMRKAEIRHHFDEIVAFAGVERFLELPVKHYSSGMLVRLAFAVAAHLASEVLLIDEALAVGDAEYQQRCLAKLRAVVQQGRTVIFVSHDLGAVRQLCHRGLWLDRGRLAASGPIQDVLDAYQRSVGEAAVYESRRAHARPAGTPGVSAVSLATSSGSVGSRFAFGDTMRMTVEVESPAPFGLSCVIRAASGNVIARSSSLGHHGISFERATSAVVVEIGPLPLPVGAYAIDLEVISTDDGVLDEWLSAIQFEVSECAPYRPGRQLRSGVDGLCLIPTRFRAQGA